MNFGLEGLLVEVVDLAKIFYSITYKGIYLKRKGTLSTHQAEHPFN